MTPVGCIPEDCEGDGHNLDEDSGEGRSLFAEAGSGTESWTGTGGDSVMSRLEETCWDGT